MNETWQPVILNLASGSFGVVVTLLLTGWWNLKDRRREQKYRQLEVVVRYVQEMDAAVKRISALTAIPLEQMSPEHKNAVWETLNNFPVLIQRLGIDVFAQVTNAHIRFHANMNMANFQAAMHDMGIDMSPALARNPNVSPDQTEKYRAKEPEGWDTTLKAIQRALRSIDYTNNAMLTLARKKYAAKLSPWQQFQSWRLRKLVEKKTAEAMESFPPEE